LIYADEYVVIRNKEAMMLLKAYIKETVRENMPIWLAFVTDSAGTLVWSKLAMSDEGARALINQYKRDHPRNNVEWGHLK
jgi:hypothetical protein